MKTRPYPALLAVRLAQKELSGLLGFPGLRKPAWTPFPIQACLRAWMMIPKPWAE